MPLDLAKSRLSGKPYFDDYNEEKNFHRVLFRPAAAVQVRELNQIQSIFQNQIERFAASTFKEGSIVSGCAFQHHANWQYLAVAPVNDAVRTTVVNDEGSPSVGEHLIGKTFVQRYPSGAETIESRGTIVQVKLGVAGAGDPTKIFFVYDNDNKVSTAVDATANDTFGYPLTIYDSTERIIDRVKLTLNGFNLVTKGTEANYIRVGDVVEGVTSKARGIVVDNGNENSGTAPTTRSYLILERNYSTFLANEEIRVVNRTATIGGTVSIVSNIAGVVPVERLYGNEIGQIVPYTSTSQEIQAGTALSGVAYGITVQAGKIYQKGHFIRVDGQSTIVNQFDASPANKLVGFETIEEIITEYVDDSLYDNALGTPNYNAPGAHRLRLTPKLLVIDRTETAKYPDFLPIVEYGPDGAAFERTNPQYSALGDELARRTYEESGNYTVRPFAVTTARNAADSTKFKYRVGAGIAYANGRRVETIKTFEIDSKKGVDTLSYNSLGITTSYGNYVIVSGLVGDFNPETGQVVSLRNATTAAGWLTTGNLGNLNAAAGGGEIGTANIRHIEPVSVAGIPTANQYRIYLFNIRMTGNNAFDAVRSLVLDTAPKAAADIVLEGGKAYQYETNDNGLVWQIGLESVKNQRDAANNFASSYAYQHAATATFSANTLTFTRADSFYTFAFDSNEQESVVAIPAANIVTNNLTGTLSCNTTSAVVTGTGTQFLSDIAPGDALEFQSHKTIVASVSNNTSLTLTANGPGNHNNVAFHRSLYAGVPINIRAKFANNAPTRPITVAGDDSNFTLSIPSSNGYATANASVNLLFRAIKGTSATQALPLQKKVNRNVMVKIDTSTGSGLTGLTTRNWTLGIPDVFRINSVFIGANTNNFDTTKDVKEDFTLVNEQTKRAYLNSVITLKPSVSTTKYTNKFILVSVDCFSILTPASNDRAGYFSIESYPIDDTKPIGSRDANTCRTEEIPFLTVANGTTFDLRNCIDFRPYASNTAALATTSHTSATTNPGTTATFQAVSTTYDPSPLYGRFTTNATQYVGRKEVLALNEDGKFVVLSGAPDKKPRLPTVPSNYLKIATANIPPYPSYALDEQSSATINRFSTSYDITTKQLESRRWTMRDITAIEERVSRLEYYTSLNMLEIKARDMLIVDSNGDNRFKNGFLVDDFVDLKTGRTDSPEYRITIDQERGMAVAATFPEVYPLELDLAASSGVRVTGDMVTYDYIDEPFITQPYATRYVEPPTIPPIISEPPKPTKCNDTRATNFGQVGGCVYPPEPVRCLDPKALNYNEIIDPPTTGCVYEVIPATCMDPSASNYGGAMPCLYVSEPVIQCTDPNAQNFNAYAPCVYAPTCQPISRQYTGNIQVDPPVWSLEAYGTEPQLVYNPPNYGSIGGGSIGDGGDLFDVDIYASRLEK